MQKPSIPKGTRDFTPAVMLRRNYIMDIIKSEFKHFGFAPIETPSMENSSTLMGKYGEEGDRLIFKILNSGDYLKKVDIVNDIVHLVIELERYLKGNYEESFLDFIRNNNTYINDKDLITNITNELNLNQECIRIKNELENSVNRNSDHFIERSICSFLEKSEILEEFQKRKTLSITPKISEKALRYDLTVPFARFVVQNQNDLTFPFKRYQIQPVWRADRPQKGRFREFYQCDADVVGSNSLYQEVELIQLYDAVFSKLGLKVTIQMNNRKILAGLAEIAGIEDRLIDFTVALDKLDKIGEEKVKEEMRSKGISDEAISILNPLFHFEGDFLTKKDKLKGLLQASSIGKEGIEDVEFVYNTVAELGLGKAELNLDVTLARGLNYYTGCIFEVSAEGVQMGSVGGGGRYDDLTSVFGLKNISGVGISFGLDRIYLVLEELNLFPDLSADSVQVLFVNFGEEEALQSLKYIKQLREKGINAELYPDPVKMKKQLTYANKKEIGFIVMIGEKEIENQTLTLKNMLDGSQKEITVENLIQELI